MAKSEPKTKVTAVMPKDFIAALEDTELLLKQMTKVTGLKPKVGAEHHRLWLFRLHVRQRAFRRGLAWRASVRASTRPARVVSISVASKRSN